MGARARARRTGGRPRRRDRQAHRHPGCAGRAHVTAVEPDPAMLAELHRALPDVRALAGSAEAIPLPDASVDAVQAGNAMHWFDMAVAGSEIARVLAPGGILAGLWNILDDRVEWVAGLTRVAGSAAIGPPRHARQLARRDDRGAPSEERRRRAVRLAGAGRVPAWAAPHGRLSGVDTRHQDGDARHAGTGTPGHARPDPHLPGEQAGNHGRRVRPPDADRRTPRPPALRGALRRTEYTLIINRMQTQPQTNVRLSARADTWWTCRSRPRVTT